MKDEHMSNLGNWLDLPNCKTSAILRNYHSPNQKREAYIDVYVNEHPYPSWKWLCEALRGVGLPDQADEVESTYVRGTTIHG